MLPEDEQIIIGKLGSEFENLKQHNIRFNRCYMLGMLAIVSSLNVHNKQLEKLVENINKFFMD